MRKTGLLLPLALLFIAGCLAQPVDSVTGAKVGDAVSLGAGAPPPPTVNPATGNPVVLKPTRQVDLDRVVDGSKSTLDAASPFIPSPWRELLVGVASVAVTTYHQTKVKKALNTPAPGSAGGNGSS